MHVDPVFDNNPVVDNKNLIGKTVLNIHTLYIILTNIFICNNFRIIINEYLLSLLFAN